MLPSNNSLIDRSERGDFRSFSLIDGGWWQFVSSSLKNSSYAFVSLNYSLSLSPVPSVSFAYNLDRLYCNVDHAGLNSIRFEALIGEFEKADAASLQRHGHSVTFHAVANRNILAQEGSKNIPLSMNDKIRIRFSENIPACRILLTWTKSSSTLKNLAVKNFTNLAFLCCVEQVNRESNLEKYLESLLQLNYLVGTDLSLFIQNCIDWVKSASQSAVRRRAFDESVSPIKSLEPELILFNEFEAWPIRLVDCSFFFQGFSIGALTLSNENEHSDVILLIAAGQSHFHFSTYPSIESSLVLNETSFNLREKCFPSASGKTQFMQETLEFFSPGLSTFAFASMECCNLRLQVSPIRNGKISSDFYLNVAANIELVFSGRVPIEISGSVNKNMPALKNNANDLLGVRSVEDLFLRKIRLQLKMDNTQIFLEPAILLLVVSQYLHYKTSWNSFKSRMDILRKRGVITYEPLDEILSSFDFVGRMQAMQTSVLKESQEFLIDYKINFVNVSGLFEAKSSVSVFESKVAFFDQPACLIFKINQIELEALQTPQLVSKEIDSVDLVDLSKVFGPFTDQFYDAMDCLNDEKLLEYSGADQERILQTISFSCKISFFQAAFFEKGQLSFNFFSNSMEIADYFTSTMVQNRTDFLLLPTILAQGNGSVHPTLLKMNFFVSSSGPLVSFSAKSVKYFLELFEAIENMVFTIFLLYPPELEKVSTIIRNDSKDQANMSFFDNYPFLLKRLVLSMLCMFQPGECMFFSQDRNWADRNDAMDGSFRMLSKISLPIIRFCYNGDVPTLVPFHSLSQEILMQLPASLLNSYPEHILTLEFQSLDITLNADILILLSEIQEVYYRQESNTLSAADRLESLCKDVFASNLGLEFFIRSFPVAPALLIVLFSFLFKEQVSKRSRVFSSREIQIELGNIVLSISIHPSKVILSCLPFCELSHMVLENFNPFNIFISSVLMKDEKLNQSDLIRLISSTFTGTEFGISLLMPHEDPCMIFTLGYGSMNVAAVLGVLNRSNFHQVLVHTEDTQFHVLFSKIRVWAAFELAWLSRASFYQSGSAQIESFHLATHTKLHHSFLFDFFITCRCSNLLGIIDMSEINNIYSSGPIKVRVLDYSLSQMIKNLEEVTSKFTPEKRDYFSKYEIDVYDIEWEMKSKRDGFFSLFSCHHFLVELERLPIGADGRELELWNKNTKLYRNLFVFHIDPVEFQSSAHRISYLMSFHSFGLLEIYIEDMINVERECWEINVELRHENASLNISLSADTAVYFTAASQSFLDLINQHRQYYFDQISKSLLSKSDLVSFRPLDAAGGLKLTSDRLNGLAKFGSDAKNLAVGSVDVLTGAVVFQIHGDGQDKSWVNIAIEQLQCVLLSNVVIDDAFVLLQRDFTLVVNPIAENSSPTNAVVIDFVNQGQKAELLCKIPALTIMLKSSLDLRTLSLNASFETAWLGSVSMSSNVYVYKNIKRVCDIYTRKSASSVSHSKPSTTKYGAIVLKPIPLELSTQLPWLAFYSSISDTSFEDSGLYSCFVF